MKLLTVTLLLFICTALNTPDASAQTNLLLDPNARSGVQNWRSNGEAMVEEFDGKRVFVIRDKEDDRVDHFSQDVDLSLADAGKYALLIGRGSSERINADGSITGLPVLYGYMLESKAAAGARINAYLQGQMMLANTRTPDAWVTMYGIYQVPENTVAIRFFLNQASRRGVPPNGSAARFNDLGLYLFDSEEAAKHFVRAKTNSTN